MSLSNAKIASATKTALVIGTTGINNAQKNKIKSLGGSVMSFSNDKIVLES